MANVDFSTLQALTAISSSDQILIRRNNALSGAAGFGRITQSNFEYSTSTYTTVNSVSADWTNTSTTVRSLSPTWGGGGSSTSYLTGGNANQILTKNSSTDYDVSWKNRRTTYTLQTLSASGTINCNALSADQFVVTLSGVALSATFAVPTNPYDSQIIMWNVRYTTNIARIILSSSFRLPTTTLNWSLSTNRMDIFAAKYNALDSKWDIISFIPGYII